jgi:indole-3-glycerol phosphate synthase
MVRHARSTAQQTESTMTDREARAARNQQKSLEAFLQQKARFDAMVAELQQMSADHFGADPEDVLWSKAATLEHWNSRLASVTDCYFKRGEFAE